MATPGRGLARERHTAVKAAVAAAALAGFAAAWLGLARSHHAGADTGPDILATTSVTGDAATSTATPAGASGGTEPPAKPTATPAAIPRSRVSRGS